MSRPRDQPSTHDEPTSATSLEDVRSRLRGLGYLDHSVERYLLQDAMRPERPVRSVLALALKVGILGGAPLAAANTFVLAWANQLFGRAPADVALLLLHLLAPCVLGLGVFFVGLGGILALVLQLSHARRIETLSMVAATVASFMLVGVAAFYGRGAFQGVGTVKGSTVKGMAVALVTLILAVVLIRVLHGGLLTLAIRLRDRPPERPVTRLVWQTVPAVIMIALVAVPTLFGGRADPKAPSSLPARAGVRVAVVGVDGVRADDLDALLGSGDLPAFSERLAAGGVLASYSRPITQPAAFWTTVVTGLEPSEHGLVAVDGYRPRGMRTTLTRTGWWRPYFVTIGAWTRLVDHRPVLAPSRRVPAVWDLASRGGVPVLVVNWWGTFPAEPLPGLMIAHGAYQLLPDGAEGAVTPVAEAVALATRLDAMSSAPIDSMLGAASSDLAARVRDRALGPDLFYRSAFADGLAAGPRFAALYLPGLDIAADLADLGTVTEAELVRWQLEGVDSLLARIDDSVDTLIVMLDPGRLQDGSSKAIEGRVLIWRRDLTCGTGGTSSRSNRPSIQPAQVASALARTLGLPQSREWPTPPDVCSWPPASLVIDSYGVRDPPSPPDGGDEYLENLRSLGYL